MSLTLVLARPFRQFAGKFAFISNFYQLVGLKTQDADFRVKYFGAKKVNMLIRKNLHFIKGRSKMLISDSATF
jgi:hypothetical protein